MIRFAAALALACAFAHPAAAEISADEIARLGRDLTPLGGERAGNAEGTIPEWTGGITKPPAGYEVGRHHPDPYAADRPPFVNMRGVPHINTFLVFVSSVAVPAGFTRDDLPAGITFLGRPYDDGRMIRFAYAYEQATRHRRPPATAPAL